MFEVRANFHNSDAGMFITLLNIPIRKFKNGSQSWSYGYIFIKMINECIYTIYAPEVIHFWEFFTIRLYR